jgi:hypothetical protein
MLRLAGVETRVLLVRGAGHSWGGLMARSLEEAFSWLTDGDDRW